MAIYCGRVLESEDTHPSLKFGRYLVSHELGRGGMGIVYEATDPQIGRRLAIKIINFQSFTTSEESTALRDRLFREARSAGALSHPGIVVIYRSAAGWPSRSSTSNPSPPVRNPPPCATACFARHAPPVRFPTLGSW